MTTRSGVEPRRRACDRVERDVRDARRRPSGSASSCSVGEPDVDRTPFAAAFRSVDLDGLRVEVDARARARSRASPRRSRARPSRSRRRAGCRARQLGSSSRQSRVVACAAGAERAARDRSRRRARSASGVLPRRPDPERPDPHRAGGTARQRSSQSAATSAAAALAEGLPERSSPAASVYAASSMPPSPSISSKPSGKSSSMTRPRLLGPRGRDRDRDAAGAMLSGTRSSACRRSPRPRR